MLFLTQKSELVHAEGELDFIGGTLVPAGERSVSDLLGKSEGEEGLFDLGVLGHESFSVNFVFCHCIYY